MKRKKVKKILKFKNGSTIIFGIVPKSQALIGIEQFRGAIEHKHSKYE